MNKRISRFLFLIAISLLVINGSSEHLGYHMVNTLLILIMASLFIFVVWAIYNSRRRQ